MREGEDQALDTQRTNVDELVEVQKKNKGWQGIKTH